MAVENGVQNAELGYLLFPFEQYSNLAGKPLVGGHMEIYEAGTDTKYISYSNWDGAENTFRIPIPNDGRITVLADPTKTFDCYLYDSYNNLVCSRLNVQANVPGNISINGADTRINNTDGTLDVSLRTLGDNVRQYTVNTHNKVLDVQEPLYFVENSNTATVIGFSGDSSSSISGKMDESKLEYNAYGEISAYNGSAFASQGGGAGDPAVNGLVHANSATWNEVSAKLDTTAFSTASGNFLTAIPDDYATKDYVQSSVSSKLDSTAFSTVSGSFLTAHQDLSDYLTKVSADTLYQPIGNYADTTALDGKVDTSSFTAFSSTTNEKIEYISGALSGTYELSAGEGIDITDYPNEQKTVISVTAQGGNPEVENLVIANSATWDSVTGKVDTSSFTAFSSTTNENIAELSARYNETVLWSGALTVGNTAQMTESVSAFERYKFYLLGVERKLKVVDEFWTDGASTGNEPYRVNPIIFQAGGAFFTINAGVCMWNASWDNLQYLNGYNKWMPYTGSTWNQLNTDTDSPTIVKIVGINRKQ